MYLLLEKIGSGTLDFLETSGRMGMFLMRALTSMFQMPFKVNPVVRQVHFIGARSAFVILFTGLFTVPDPFAGRREIIQFQQQALWNHNSLHYRYRLCRR